MISSFSILRSLSTDTHIAVVNNAWLRIYMWRPYKISPSCNIAHTDVENHVLALAFLVQQHWRKKNFQSLIWRFFFFQSMPEVSWESGYIWPLLVDTDKSW